MRIGVDGSSLIERKSGIGSFASLLLEAIKNRAGDIEFLVYRPGRAGDLNVFGRLCWENASLVGRARKDGVDFLYSPGFAPPLVPAVPKIVTVHDLIGMIYPQNTGPISRFYWSFWLPRAIRTAHKIIASSESTKRDLIRLLGFDGAKIDVVPLCASRKFRIIEDPVVKQGAQRRYGIEGPFFISVSTLERRKNLPSLIRGMLPLFSEFKDLTLVLAGKPGGAEDEIQALIRQKGLQRRVKLLGYLPTDDIISLYNSAVGFVSISLYEGFGLPALEAMSCGLTGVVSDNSSLPEVVGEAALKVPPENTGAIGRALRSLLVDKELRARLARSAQERSGQFSIEKTADNMIEIFRRQMARQTVS